MILGIYGAGGVGREARDIAELLGLWDETVFIDDVAGEGLLHGLQRMPYEKFCRCYSPEATEIIVAVGEPEHKIALYRKVKHTGYPLAKLIHPMAYISPSAVLGEGVIVKMGSFVSCDTVIEANVSIEIGCMIAHDCIVRESSQISSGVSLGGGDTVGAGVFIGMNACVKEKTKIGSHSIIGMGSVVLRDIPENVIAWGNPAKVQRPRDGARVFQ